MELVAAVVAAGWASGINAGGTLLVLGLLGRLSGADSIPAVLQQTDVLIVVALWCALEVIVDKFPYVNSWWDIPGTITRPAAGVFLGITYAHGSGAALTLLLASVGGFLALAAHLTKAAVHLALNAEPRVFTIVFASVTADVSVTVVTILVALSPFLAAASAITLLLASLGVLRRSLRPAIPQGWAAMTARLPHGPRH